VRAAIADSATSANRLPEDVTLVAVTKMVPVELIREAIAAGHRTFGENRVQEAVPKIDELSANGHGVRWHLVGHLQTNKVRLAAERFSVVESVDSVRLATRLDARAGSLGRRLPVLLEVNVAGERSKWGFCPQEVGLAVREIGRLPHLEMRGLMTVAPLLPYAEDVRWVFRALRELRDGLQAQTPSLHLPELSMGMSHDFQVAVEEGATIVRIGRALFGERLPGR
jgi:pyridoxal phosphate enzyme (YggS family)